MIGFLVFVAVSLVAVILAFTVPDHWVTRVSSLMGSLAAASLLYSGIVSFFIHSWSLNLWQLRGWGLLVVGEPHLSAFFILVTALVFLPVSWFSPAYLRRLHSHYDLRYFALLYHVLMMAIVMTFLAQDVITFLLSWEIMSVASYLAVNFEHLQDSHTQAGYMMLGASEAGFLLTLGAWLPLIAASHSIDFSAIQAASAHDHSASLAMGWAVMLCSFFGFGVKAGLFPSMSWLPRAHPAAPANFSAILSGVILNLGIYGIIEVNTVLWPIRYPAQGLLILVIGSMTALIGILYASTENHLKRMLAHSSIENMGLIATALGAMFTFRAAHLPELAWIAGIAALYQILNHSVYKSLLFLGAGAIDVSTGDLEMDHLGGLARLMPWTSVFLLAGVMAISALPPFNGFISEWLIIQSLLRSVVLKSTIDQVIFAFSGVIVALTAGLAATAFIKLYGMIFLGQRRSAAAENAHEAGSGPRWALGILALGCLILGVTPTYVATGLSPLAVELAKGGTGSGLIPTFFSPQHLPRSLAQTFGPLGAELGRHILPGPGLAFLYQSPMPSQNVVFASSPSYLAIAMALLLGLLYLSVHVLRRRRQVVRHEPWQGGVKQLPADAHYTATGFSNPIVVIFRAILRPYQPVEHEQFSASHFHTAVRREVRESYVVDRLVFLPVAALVQSIAQVLARIHHGKINVYIAYALFTLLIVLALSLWILP